METQKNEIMERAAHIIMDSGLDALTLSNLEVDFKLQESPLFSKLTKDEDILLMLINSLETDLKGFVDGLARSNEDPDAELKILFKKLYFLFLQKPYYLNIIFDHRSKNESINASLQRIKKIAESYLTSVIERGKTKYIFKTKLSTEQLVENIMSGFRMFMKDEQQVNEMILELKH